MDSLQFWLYVIVGVIYLLSRMRKKPQEQPKDLGDYRPEKPVKQFEQPTSKPTAPKQLTFEELLREITEGKKVEKQPEVVDYDEMIGEEEQDFEEVDYDYKKQDKIYEVYEQAKAQAFARPSLEETMKLSDTKMEFGKFKVFEEEERRDLLGEYLADLKDPEGFKKAVVMSEILQRKYWFLLVMVHG